MEIKRDAYLQQLIERKDNGMIKVITGIRRCGKSFLLFTIFKRYLLENGVDVDHIIEIALDGIENEELRDPKVCFKYIKDAMKDDGKYYLLLDEVQFMPRFEEQFASLNGKPLALSAMEYKMLNLFLKNPKQVLTRQQLLERLWDIDEKYVDEHTLTTSISRIRSKIEADGDTYIKTVYGMGYQWTGGEKK